MIARKRFAAVLCSLAALSIIEGVRFFFNLPSFFLLYFLTRLFHKQLFINILILLSDHFGWEKTEGFFCLVFLFLLFDILFIMVLVLLWAFRWDSSILILNNQFQLSVYKVFPCFCRCIVSQWGNLYPLPDLWWTHVLPVCWRFWGNELWK